MITLEYLPDGSANCPLVRLYNYERSDVESLRSLCLALAAGRLREIALEKQAWVIANRDCSFVLRASQFDRGVRAPLAGAHFVMEYSSEGWLEIADKLTPFVDGSGGFQWLTNEGEVNVLLSVDGRL